MGREGRELGEQFLGTAVFAGPQAAIQFSAGLTQFLLSGLVRRWRSTHGRNPRRFATSARQPSGRGTTRRERSDPARTNRSVTVLSSARKQLRAARPLIFPDAAGVTFCYRKPQTFC